MPGKTQIPISFAPVGRFVLVFMAVVNAVPPPWIFKYFSYRTFIIMPMIAFGWACFAPLLRKNPRFLMNVLRQPTSIFMMVYMINGLFTANRVSHMELFEAAFLRRFVYAAAYIYIFALSAWTPKDLLWALIAHGIVACGVSIWAFSDGMAQGFRGSPGEGTDLFLHYNYLSDICAGAGLIAFGLFVSVRKRSVRIVAVIGGIFSVLATLACTSRAALLAVGAALYAMFMYKRLSAKAYLIMTVSWMIAVASFFAIMPPERLSARTESRSGSSFAARPYLWTQSVEYLFHSNFTPAGWGQPVSAPVSGIIIENYCNVFFEDLIESGISGLVCSIGILVSSLWLAWRNVQEAPQKSPIQAINLIAVGFVVQKYFHGCFDSYWSGITHHSTAYMAIGIITYLRVYLKEMRASAPSLPSDQ